MTDRCVTTVYPGGAYCVDCDEQPFIATVPEHIDTIIDRAWDSGANSIASVEAPCYVQWTAPTLTVGEMLGLNPLFPPRVDVTDPTNIAAAFYVYTIGTQMFAQPVAFGSNVGSAHGINSSAVLRIEHIGVTASFKLNGTIIATCPLSDGANRVAIAIYQSGDHVSTPTFAALTTWHVEGTVVMHGRGSLRGSFSANFGTLHGRGRLIGTRVFGGILHGRGRLEGSSFSSYGSIHGHGALRATQGLVDPHPSYGELHGHGRLVGVGTIRDYGDGHLYGRGRLAGSFSANYGSIHGRGRLQGEEDVTPPGAILFLLQSPGIMQMTSGYSKETIGETIAFTDTPTQRLVNQIIESIRLTDTPMSFLSAIEQIVEKLDVVDQIAVIWRMIIAESLALTGVAAPSWIAVERIFETLRLIGGPSTTVHLFSLIVETLGLQDALAVIAREHISESTAFTETVTSHLDANVHLVENMLLTAVPTGFARISAIINETISLADNPAASLHAFEHLLESVDFSVTIHIGDTLYLAWVVNTESRAATTYEQYPFNSFTDEFDKHYYGAAEDGIYELEGSTDDGDAINARVRLGLNDLGTGKEKRIPSLYLGYTATGRLLLKVTITEVDGSRTENWYQLTPRGAGDMREGRIKIGRGLKAVYWDIEIANIDGADFSFSDLKLFPMILDRRIRGQDG